MKEHLFALYRIKCCLSRPILEIVREAMGAVVGHVMLCVKADWIAWLASVEMIAANKNETYTALLKEYKRQKQRNPTA